MIDIETLGNKPGSIIFEVGAVSFDRNQVLDTFHAFLPTAASSERGFTIDLVTLQWWAKQGKTLEEILDQTKDAPTINDTMLKLASFITGHNHYWSKGNFDYPLLARYFDSCNLQTPWKYGQVRELRTMLSELDMLPPKQEATHNALEDAMRQVELLVDMRRRLH